MGSGQRQACLWGAAPRDWAELQEPFCLPLWRDALAALAVKPGLRFLDAGCGGGGACLLASGIGCEVVGLDACEPLLAIARARLPRTQFVQGDLEDLPFPNGHFDAVLAANSVIFAEDVSKAASELRRVLRSGGRAVVTSWGKPEQCDMRRVFAAVAGSLPTPPPGGGPFAWSEDGKLAGLLTKAGFKVLAEGDSQCDFRYADFGAFWRAQSSAGNYQPALQAVGADRLRDSVAAAVLPHTQTDGSILLRNVYRWTAGQVA